MKITKEENSYKEISIFNTGLKTFELLYISFALTIGIFIYKVKYILGVFKNGK